MNKKRRKGVALPTTLGVQTPQASASDMPRQHFQEFGSSPSSGAVCRSSMLHAEAKDVYHNLLSPPSSVVPVSPKKNLARKTNASSIEEDPQGRPDVTSVHGNGHGNVRESNDVALQVPDVMSHETSRTATASSIGHNVSRRYRLAELGTNYLLGLNARFCWAVTTFLVFVVITFSAELKALNIDYESVGVATSMNMTKFHEERNLYHVPLLTHLRIVATCMSIAGTLSVSVAYVLSKSFREDTFSGVAELCFSFMCLDVTRTVHLIIAFEKQDCTAIGLVMNFFKPATSLFIAAIAINLLMSVNGRWSDEPGKLNVRMHQKLYAGIYLYSLIHTIVREIYVDSSHMDRDLFMSCVFYTQGVFLYEMVILPGIVCILAVMSTIAFNQHIKNLYPTNATKKISFRSNQYLKIFAVTWVAAVVLPFCGVGNVVFISDPTFKIIAAYGAYLIFALQGFFFSFLTISVYQNDAVDSGLHLQNIYIDEIDFGEPSTIVGEGTFAVVFHAEWRKRSVAVKVFKLSEVDKEKMKMEAYLASKLNHPHLVKTYGCALVDNDRISIVSEYIDGGTLDELITSSKENSYRDILNYSRMIASAIEFLHTRSPPIVHRDLKPGNIFVDRCRTLIKVADFGCSRWFSDETYTQRKTGRRVFTAEIENARTMTSNIGSPCWTAPELMADTATATYTLKVDVYSFGIILWQLYTGKMPFEEIHGSLLALEEAVLEGRRPPIPKDCPILLSRLMEYCWASRPEVRPSFSDIIQIIDSELVILDAFEDYDSDYLV